MSPSAQREHPHVYLSPACLHGEHEQCEKSCPICRVKCVCDCHVWGGFRMEKERPGV